MNIKLKALALGLALSFVGMSSANAALVNQGTVGTRSTSGAGANGSSVIFSAWDNAGTGTGYSFDLGLYLNNIIGADTTGGVNNSNTLTDSGNTYSAFTTGSVLSIALPDFNLSSGSWNLAATDSVGRKRELLTNASNTWGGATNSDMGVAAGNTNGYIALSQ